MKLRNTLSITLVLVMLLSLLTACGSSPTDSVARQEAAEAPAAMESNGSLMDSGSGSGASLPENRKWIITVDMSAETEDLDTLMDSLDDTIAALEGNEKTRISTTAVLIPTTATAAPTSPSGSPQAGSMNLRRTWQVLPMWSAKT